MKNFGIRLFFVGCVAVSLLSCNGNTDANQQVVVPQPAPTAQVDTMQPQAQPAAPAAAAQTQAVPEAINTFVQQYFPGATIAGVQVDNEYGGQEYDIYLSDGTQIDFDRNNQWDNVECRASAVPAALVPQAIANYVKSKFPSIAIVKIDKDMQGYDIELSNGLDLEFDQAGNFMRMDD